MNFIHDDGILAANILKRIGNKESEHLFCNGLICLKRNTK